MGVEHAVPSEENEVQTRRVRPAWASFDAFYRQHADPLRRALCLAVGDVDLGNEAADEAMTRAYERWSEVADYDNRVGWVYRVGLNWAVGRRRRARWHEDGPVPDHGVLPVHAAPELARALERLSTEYRAVVVCRYYLDWSIETTAAALAIPAGTVKSRLTRAMVRLQRDLEDR